MPKRKRDETKEERWSRKLKKYEARLNEKRRRNSQRIIYSSDEEDVHNEEPLEPRIIDLDGVEDDNLSIPINEELLSVDNVESVETSPAEVFDVDLLQALGNTETETAEYADDIHTDIANTFQKILVNGLKKEIREELIKKYLLPKNVPYTKAPTLNPEIEAMLQDTYRLRDKRLLNKQDQLGRALSALGKAMTFLLKKNPDITEVIRTLNDAGKLLADSHYAETDTRRSVIIPLIEKSLTDTFKNRNRDNFLFGEGLGEVVKNSRGIKKTSQLIQSQSSTSHLNYKGPSTRPRQQWFGQTYLQQRAGGQRAKYPGRRRATAPLPPPPYIRSQAPPPPPQPLRRQAPQKPHLSNRPQK